MHVHNDTSGSEQHTKPHICILIEIRPIEPWRSIDRLERHWPQQTVPQQTVYTEQDDLHASYSGPCHHSRVLYPHSPLHMVHHHIVGNTGQVHGAPTRLLTNVAMDCECLRVPFGAIPISSTVRPSFPLLDK